MLNSFFGGGGGGRDGEGGEKISGLNYVIPRLAEARPPVADATALTATLENWGGGGGYRWEIPEMGGNVGNMGEIPDMESGTGIPRQEGTGHITPGFPLCVL